MPAATSCMNMHELDAHMNFIIYSNQFFSTANLESTVTITKLLDFKFKDGRSVNICEEIGAHYFEFGVNLLDDHSGQITTGIMNDERQAKRINQALLMRWLETSRTWKQLIAALRKCKLNALADNITEGISLN